MPVLMQLHEVAEAGRLGPVSVAVRSGEIIHLTGPNGAGKSTLLTRIAGLSGGLGEVIFNDQSLEEYPASVLARQRAFLAQQQTPPFAMPVWHYLRLHQAENAQGQLLQRVADKLHLTDKLNRQVNQLSGGEWQRVRLAAVIVQIHPHGNPQGQLLLLDEPMNSLDVAQQAALDYLLDELCQAGVTIIMSGHDLNHTLRHAHRVWLMRDGQMLACGATAETLTPPLLTRAYGMPFRRLDVAGERILLAGA